MAQDNKTRILEAASAMFGTRGFHGTSTRDIAEKAGVSLGNIYNHFKTKEALFEALLADWQERYFAPGQPLGKALASGRFPDDLEEIAAASRETVEKYRDYIRLIYVDVIEFDAVHIGKLFQGMRSRYAKTPAANLAPGVDPAAAKMLVTWGFFNYFIVERLFGVKDHYGLGETKVVELFCKVFREGLAADASAGRPRRKR